MRKAPNKNHNSSIKIS